MAEADGLVFEYVTGLLNAERGLLFQDVGEFPSQNIDHIWSLGALSGSRMWGAAEHWIEIKERGWKER